MNVNEFIETWVKIITHPIIVNKKQGFLLNNGMRILFHDTGLTNDSKVRLMRHYRHQRLLNQS